MVLCVKCAYCNGRGYIIKNSSVVDFEFETYTYIDCMVCDGKGILGVEDLKID